MKLKMTAIVSLLMLAPGAFAQVSVDHSMWDRILKTAIKGQLVDYHHITAEHMSDLTGYLNMLATIDVTPLPRNEQLAYYINLYNASMVKAVIDSRAANPAWRPDADGFSIFKKPLVRTATGVITLDHLEHQIVRPTFSEPRVHVALVCGAVSCPPLINHAYTGENLETTLAGNMERFLQDNSRNQYDHPRKVAHLSRLFDWFSADFGGPISIPTYIASHGGPELRGYRVEFLEYNWALNELRQ